MRFISGSKEETYRFGATMAKAIGPGSVILLQGGLGAGKTVLTQGMAKGLGVRDRVTSPTFVIMQPYAGRLTLYHVDLYRLEDLKAIRGWGLDEYLYGDGVCVVEWPERFRKDWPDEYIHVRLDYAGEQQRAIHLSAKGSGPRNILKRMAGKVHGRGRTARPHGKKVL
jgi:tRNA threonylcarbamoyladenosine biosynthesis protein TsaE